MFFLDIDLSQFGNLADELKEKLEETAKREGENLAHMILNKIQEDARTKLHSRQKMFLDGLHFKKVGNDTWIVSLDQKVRWIDDGMCVVYGKHDKLTPEVLTPDGFVKITSIRPGQLVLNQHGKWTRVIYVHDHHLLDFCQYMIDEQATVTKFGYSPEDISPKSRKLIVLRCPNCNQTRDYSKFDWARKQEVFCKSCQANRLLVTLKFTVKGKHRSLTLTAEHPVFTKEAGWVQAKDLDSSIHTIFAPAWGVCPNCSNKVIFGEGFCSQSCVSSFVNNKRLAEGAHPSQDPEWLANVYKKKISIGNRPSGVEDVVQRLLEARGQTVQFYNKAGNTANWIRQFPVASTTDRLGRQKYYFLDFYSPKLKLALEVDGKAFHSAERDEPRDQHIRQQLDIQIIRIPAKEIRSKKFENTTLPAILANHMREIELAPLTNYSVDKFAFSDSSPFSRRWDITVEDGESFVCQGILIHNSKFEMIDMLLKNAKPPAGKTFKNGRFRAIPFQQNKKPQFNTVQQQNLTDAIRATLKQNKVPYDKIETGPNGQPLEGLLHKFNVTKGHPLKTANAPQMGRGPIGQPRQGWTGTPFLQNVRIYQKIIRDDQGQPIKGPNGKVKVQRGIFTFRMVSDKQKGTGKWTYPGIQGIKTFESAYSWALDSWEQVIKPKIIQELNL